MGYWNKKRYRNNAVLQKPVLKSKKYQFRANGGLTARIEKLKDVLRQGDTKVITDILNDFFLDYELIENKKDIEHLLKGVTNE